MQTKDELPEASSTSAEESASEFLRSASLLFKFVPSVSKGRTRNVTSLSCFTLGHFKCLLVETGMLPTISPQNLLKSDVDAGDEDNVDDGDEDNVDAGDDVDAGNEDNAYLHELLREHLMVELYIKLSFFSSPYRSCGGY